MSSNDRSGPPARLWNVGAGSMRVKGVSGPAISRQPAARWRLPARRPGFGWRGAANPGTSGASLVPAGSPRQQPSDAG
jgi:hypothetical protein